MKSAICSLISAISASIFAICCLISASSFCELVLKSFLVFNISLKMPPKTDIATIATTIENGSKCIDIPPSKINLRVRRKMGRSIINKKIRQNNLYLLINPSYTSSNLHCYISYQIFFIIKYKLLQENCHFNISNLLIMD